MPSERWIPKKPGRRSVPKVAKRLDPVRPLQKALAKRTKAELIEALVDLARGDRKILRELEARFGVEAAEDELVAATRQAIVDATDFDEREVNYNFDYDYAAYETVERNLKRLVKAGALGEAMELSLALMRDGSYQVEMSDEGLMTRDVENCLAVVIGALKKADLPADQISSWCDEMMRADRVGFICDEELAALRKRVGS